MLSPICRICAGLGGSLVLEVASRTKFSTSWYDQRLRTSRITLRAISEADMEDTGDAEKTAKEKDGR